MKIKSKATFVSILLFVVIHLSFSKVRAQDNILSDLSALYLQKLIATAKENYPRLKGLNGQVTAAKHDLTTVKTSWLEPFSFQYVRRSSNTPNTGVVDLTTQDILDGYQIGVAVNLGSILSKPSQVKKAKEQIRIAEFNVDEYNLQLELEVKTRYFSYLQQKNSLQLIASAMSDAENNYNLMKLKYQKAESTLEEYNTASIAYNQARIAKITAETNYLIAKASLEELTVKKLEEIK